MILLSFPHSDHRNHTFRRTVGACWAPLSRHALSVNNLFTAHRVGQFPELAAMIHGVAALLLVGFILTFFTRSLQDVRWNAASQHTTGRAVRLWQTL